MKLPLFENSDKYNYTASKYAAKNMMFQDFLQNSCLQDRTRTPPATVMTCTKNLDHYFIYTGQDKRLGLSAQGKVRDDFRKYAEERNPNLQKLMKVVWPCNNDYVMVCKDAAYNYRMGASQKLLIGKADANDPSKMICRDDVDQPEFQDRGMRLDRTDDYYQGEVGNTDDIKKQKIGQRCEKILRKGDWPTGTSRACGLLHVGGCKNWQGLLLNRLNGKSLEECKTSCSEAQKCEDVEYFPRNRKCNLYKKGCTYIKSGRDASMYAVKSCGEGLQVGEIEEVIREGNYDKGKDTDSNWFLQHCCAKTAKFPQAMNTSDGSLS